MPFVANAEEIAYEAMASVSPDLANRYKIIIRFLASHPEAASRMRGMAAPVIGSVEYVRCQATAFASARNLRAPQAPATVPDEMVSIILQEYFDIAVADLERVKREHLLSMGAENLVGDLLERYLASVLEQHEW
ncbi:MAG: SinI family restriction endonuclease, partial [Pseudomonadota bacterium]